MGNDVGRLATKDLEGVGVEDFSEAELHKLHRRFQKMDKDGSGTLTADEFLSIPELAGNPLLSRIIAIFDTNKDDEIEFSEFVKALATFTSKDNLEGKLRFTFQVYDIDNDGFISNGELFQVLKMMVGTNLTDVQLQNIVDKTILEADEDKDGKISYDEFVKLITNTEELGAKLTITFCHIDERETFCPSRVIFRGGRRGTSWVVGYRIGPPSSPPPSSLASPRESWSRFCPTTWLPFVSSWP